MYHADESHLGRNLRCPICGTINRIERDGALRSSQTTVDQVVSVADERAGGHVARSASGSRWKTTTLIGGAALAVFALVLIWVALRPMPRAGVAPAAPPAAAEQYATSPPTEQRKQVAPSASTPLMQLRPDSRANSSQPSLNPFENVVSPTKDDADQRAVVPPCAQGQQPVRLPTGTRIEPDGDTSGPSELTVSNGTTSDAAVRLVKRDSGNTARFVYIEAGDAYELTGIEPGTYRLRFVSGRKWVPACRDFLDADYFEFESALVFENGEEDYTTMHVTLNPVPLGVCVIAGFCGATVGL